MTKTEQIGREQLHLEIIDQLHNTFIDKNADYGNSFGEMWNEDGFVVGYLKLTDKYLRVKRLRKYEAKVAGETMKDTLLDLANYAIMCLVEMELEERKRCTTTPHGHMKPLDGPRLELCECKKPLVDENGFCTACARWTSELRFKAHGQRRAVATCNCSTPVFDSNGLCRQCGGHESEEF